MSKETIHKMRIAGLNYAALTRRDLDTIQMMFGEFEIIKVRQCFGGFSMKIWIKTKGAKNE